MTYIGIDPGVCGAIAILRDDTATVRDIPTLQVARGKRMRTQYDAVACAKMLYVRSLARDVIITLEDVRPRPIGAGGRDSLVSARQMGVGVGLWLGIAGALGLPIQIVQPSVWKRHHKLLHTNKEASRAKALRLFPSLADSLKRKKDHNRAEALLIAEYGRQTKAKR